MFDRDEDLRVWNSVPRASSIDLAMKCPAKFLWKERYKLQPKFWPVQNALETGTFFHEMQQEGPEGLSKVYDKCLAKQEEIKRDIATSGDLSGEKELQLKKLNSCYEQARLMSEVLWKIYPEPENLKTVWREKKIRVIERSEGSRAVTSYEGTIDRLVSWDGKALDGNYYIRDYKTTSFKPEIVCASYPYSAAAKIYRNLVHHWLEKEGKDGEELKGFQLDIVRKCTLKFCPHTKDSNADGEFASEWAAYVERCKQWYEAQGEPMYNQMTLRYTPRMPLMDNELWNQIRYAQTLGALPHPLKEMDNVFDKYPRNSRECTGLTGNLCPYHSICSQSQKLWPMIIRNEYRQIEPPYVDIDTIVVEKGDSYGTVDRTR